MDVNKIEAVTERDIDLLLLEELNVSNDFSSWFYSVVTNNDSAPLCEGAWHSISDAALGESDLVVIYENGVALLIENKIDALAQPEQAVRYKARGEKGVKTGLWNSFVTCMVAPSLYLKKEKDANIYDSNLSYEKIASWFSSQDAFECRAKYKSYIIAEAIEQNRRGYTVIPDRQATEFWAKYWAFSSRQYPELEMKKPGIKPANSDWPDFRPSVLNNRFSIVHKLGRGDVDLQLAGMAGKLEYLKSLLADLELEVVKAGKSAAVRIKVNPINKFSSFESQKNIAIEGLDAARRLLDVGRQIQNEV